MDFDSWSELYKNDRQAFEIKRQEHLDAEYDKMLANGKSMEFVNSMRNLVWMQDQELAKCSDPTERLQKASELFHEQTIKFRKSLDELQIIVESLRK